MFIPTTPRYNWNLVPISSLDGVTQPALHHLLSTLAGHHGFSNATPSSISENKRHLNDSASNRIIPTIFSPGLISTRLFAMKNLFNRVIDITLTKPAFELGLAKTNG
jgi:hypothetical protein